MATATVVSLRELINPTPKQQEFFDAVSRYTFTLYGGAAGGGKSYSLRWLAVALLVRWAARGLHKVRVGLFCEDYPALEDRQISKVRVEFPDWLGTYRERFHTFELRPEFGGGEIAFRNLDDPSKYFSTEFAAVLVDELTKNDYKTFTDLRFRMRWPGIDDVKFAAATNPGGIGHVWVRALWVDRQFPEELRGREHEFAFVQARAGDNPHLPESYLRELASLPEAERRAYYEGDWDIFAGQKFSEWRRSIHVPYGADWYPPRGWRIFRAYDAGWTQAACKWYAVNKDGFAVCYREFYPRHMTDEQQARMIKLLSRDPDGVPEQIAYTVADPSCWAKQRANERGGASTAETFAREGVPLVKANNDRINGWKRLHSWLGPFEVNGRVTARLVHTAACVNSIRLYPAAPVDKSNPDDLDTDFEDHLLDCDRYFVMSRPQPPKDEEELRRRWRERERLLRPLHELTAY